jgi:iron complex outermembrane receptor protein
MAPPALAPTLPRRLIHSLLPSLLGLAVVAAHAQDDLSEHDYFESLPEVLTVSRLAQPLSDTPGAVTIIDRKTLQDLNVRDMADVLRLVPGYYVSGYNGANPIGVYHAPLDEFGARNLVLIDGRPAYSPYFFGGTSRGLMAVNPEDVERVEVLRGANSAAYGANAMFGVINIVTRHSTDTLGAQFTTRIGEGNIRDTRLAIGHGDSGLSWRLSASRRSDDGLKGLFDGRDLRQLQLRADARLSPQDEVHLDFGVSDLQAGEGYAGNIDNPLRTLGWRDWHISGQWQRQISDTEQLKVSMSFTRETLKDNFLYGNTGLLVDFSGVGRQLDVELQHQFNVGDSARLVWGTGFRVDEAESYPLFFRRDAVQARETRLFGNLEWRLSPRWLLNGGLFLANHNWIGSFATPRLMFNYQLAPDHTLRFGVNHSVRTPTLFELAGDVRYFAPNGTQVGRTYAATGRVRPEALQSQEIGYFANLREQRMTLDVRVYQEKMSGMISRRTYALQPALAVTGTLAYDYANLPAPVFTGLEYQVRWALGPRTELWINQNFAHMKWSANSIAIEPPAATTSLMLSHQFANHIRVGLVVTHRYNMSWRGVGQTNQSYQQSDLHISYPWRMGTTKARAALTIRNLNGAEELFVSNAARPSSRRQAYASLQFEF